MNTNGVTAYMMQLATEFGQGLITWKEYYQKQTRATMELTFSYVVISKVQKDELIDILVKESDTNPLLKSPKGEILLSIFPAYIMISADAAELDTPSKDIFDTVLQYIAGVLNPLSKK
jgi:hypothetical protein